MNSKLSRYWDLEKHGTNPRIELIAGITTFATMSYILVVQPNMMADAGMNPRGVMLATALMSAIFTLVSAFYSKMPFALAPGMGSNAIMAYNLVAAGHTTWQVGVAMFIVTGVILALLTVMGVREDMIRVMPRNIKVGIGAAIGIMIARLGVKNSGMVKPDFSGAGDFSDPRVQLALIGLLITLVLHFVQFGKDGKTFKIRGSMLISILLTTLIGIPMGVVKMPASIFSVDFNSLEEVAFQPDLKGVFTLQMLPFIAFFLFGDFFSTMGTALGLAGKAELLDKDGNLPGIGRVFMTDAIGTAVGGVFGITNVQTYVESASGIEAGGRTGMTAFFTAMMFLVAIFFAPLFMMIPSAATAPVLLLLGCSMLQVLKNVSFGDEDWVPLALMILITAFTGDFVLGTAVGVVSAVLIGFLVSVFTQDKSRMPTWGTVIMALVMSIKFFIL